MTDSAALARQLAELDRVAEVAVPRIGQTYSRDQVRLIDTMLDNLPAILRALCVMAAVDEWAVDPKWGIGRNEAASINARADELLAECTGAK